MKTSDLIPITEQMTGGNKPLADALEYNFRVIKELVVKREVTITSSVEELKRKLSKEMTEKFKALRNEFRNDVNILKEDMDILKGDVQLIKKDMGVLKKEIGKQYTTIINLLKKK